MDVQLQLDLNEEEERGFKDLILLCNKEDETDYDMGLDYDFFYSIRNEEKKESGLKEEYLAILMGYKLGEQEEGKDILLCTVFVHPFMRGQGLFTMLSESLYDDFREQRIRFMRKNKEESFLHFPYLYSEHWSILLPFREREGAIRLEKYFFPLTTKKRFTFTALWWKIDLEGREKARQFCVTAWKRAKPECMRKSYCRLILETKLL